MQTANKKQSKMNLRSQPRAERQGLASIEFLLMLPAILCALAFIFWLYRTRDAKVRAGLRAEATAMETAIWTQSVQALRNTDSLSTGGAPNLDLLIGSFASGLSAGSGWVDSELTEPTGPGVFGVVDAIGEVENSHAVLAHPLDSEVLRFPQSSQGQPPLTLPDATQTVAPGLPSMGVFSRLLSF